MWRAKINWNNSRRRCSVGLPCWKGWPSMTAERSLSVERSISVIVNTTDRAATLQTLLNALEQQAYGNFEVIVVVGPTRDHTLDVLRTYGGRVQVLRCAKANLGQSRNIGLVAARGELVAYID